MTFFLIWRWRDCGSENFNICLSRQQRPTPSRGCPSKPQHRIHWLSDQEVLGGKPAPSVGLSCAPGDYSYCHTAHFSFISSHRLLQREGMSLKCKNLHCISEEEVALGGGNFPFYNLLLPLLPDAVNYLPPHCSSYNVSQGSFTLWEAVSRRCWVSGLKGGNCSSLQIPPFPQIAW